MFSLLILSLLQIAKKKRDRVNLKNRVYQAEHHSQGTMALVHETEYYSGSRAFAGSPQYNCGPRIRDRSVWMLNPRIFNKIQQKWGPSGYMFCIQTENSAEKILQLETRPRSRISGCLQPELEQPTGEEGLCQSPLEPSRQSAEQSTATTGHTDPSGSSMEEPAMVPHPTGDAAGLPNPPPA